MEKKYNLIYNYEDVKKIFVDTPFNLRADLKSINDMEDFIEKLGSEIVCKDNPPQRCVLHKKVINKKEVSIKKIRVGTDDSGKSGGYRAIVYFDEINCLEDFDGTVILLHIISKKQKDDLSQDEKNKLKKFYNNIINSLK